MNLNSPQLDKFRREFARAVTNRKIEVTPNGVLFIEQSALMAGMITHTVNGADQRVDQNTFTIEGLNNLLLCAFHSQTPETAFYVAPFSGSGTPSPTLTAATFPGTMTEFTAYVAATRPEYVEGAVSAGAVSNSASRAEITANASGNVWGAGLASVSTKSATTGVLAACAKFSAVRALTNTDILAFQWTLTLTPV